jgi:hypothetical protein
MSAPSMSEIATLYHAEVTDMPGTPLGRPHHPSSETSKSVSMGNPEVD